MGLQSSRYQSAILFITFTSLACLFLQFFFLLSAHFYSRLTYDKHKSYVDEIIVCTTTINYSSRSRGRDNAYEQAGSLDDFCN